MLIRHSYNNQSAGSHHDIVDLEDHPHDFGGKGECALGHQRGLQDAFFLHVDDVALLDTDSGEGLAFGVPVSELGDDVDRADSCVFGKSVRDDLQGFCVTSVDDCLEAFHLGCSLLELVGDLEFC